MVDPLKVLFVGQNPSKKNDNPLIPFIGTKSHARLLEWIEYLGITNYYMTNVFNQVELPTLTEIYSQAKHLQENVNTNKPTHIIALGMLAHNVLTELGINHYTLPHPSGLNRRLNDKAYLHKKLDRCKKYLKQVSIDLNQ